MNDRHRAYLTAGMAGLAGAALAALAGLPAGPLMGSTLAVSAVVAAGGRVAVPQRVRDVAFALIGVSLGSGIDEATFSRIGAWGLSLAILAASLVATLFVGRMMLTRIYRFDGDTAVLSSAPGTMSNIIALTIEGRGDATAVVFLQLMRLLVLVIAVPPFAVLFDASTAQATGTGSAMGLAGLGVLIALALAAGIGGTRLGVPAACLLAGMVLSATAHATGLVHGLVPRWAVFLAFTVTGTVIGSRLTGVTGSQAKRYAAAGLSSVAVAFVLSLGFAGVAAGLTGLPFGQVWIAFAPGGVEAMAAIGLSLGFDPTYVAVHHFARILVLILVVPVALRVGRPAGGGTG